MTWTAALEGRELKPVALTDRDPDDAEQDSFTSGRATLNEPSPQENASAPSRMHQALTVFFPKTSCKSFNWMVQIQESPDRLAGIHWDFPSSDNI